MRNVPSFIDVHEALGEGKENEISTEDMDMEGAPTVQEPSEIETLFGKNPRKENKAEIAISDDLADFINTWTKSGLTNKEEKEELLSSIPRTGKVSLVAPNLNEEIAANLHPKAQAKDNHFKEYQDQAGTALAAVASVLNHIVEERKPDRQSCLKLLRGSVMILSDLVFQSESGQKGFPRRTFRGKDTKNLEII